MQDTASALGSKAPALLYMLHSRLLVQVAEKMHSLFQQRKDAHCHSPLPFEVSYIPAVAVMEGIMATSPVL